MPHSLPRAVRWLPAVDCSIVIQSILAPLGIMSVKKDDPRIPFSFFVFNTEKVLPFKT
jgi:hypothetical protein